MCVLVSSTKLVRTIYILRRNERRIIVNVLMASCKVPVSLGRFY